MSWTASQTRERDWGSGPKHPTALRWIATIRTDASHQSGRSTTARSSITATLDQLFPGRPGVRRNYLFDVTREGEKGLLIKVTVNEVTATIGPVQLSRAALDGLMSCGEHVWSEPKDKPAN